MSKVEDYEMFECQMCGALIIKNTSIYDEKRVYPSYCDELQGGCGRKSKFYRLKKDEKVIACSLEKLKKVK